MSTHTTPALRSVAILSAALAAGAHGQVWTEHGPAPIINGQYTGRISAVVCSPTDFQKYFVAGADGGVWRTTNGGISWTPLTGDMPTSATGALALDPTNEDVIYAGTGEGNHANHSRYGLGVLKSTDGGDTWTQLGQGSFSGRCFTKIVVSHQNPQMVFASVTRAGGFPEMAAAKSHPAATGPRGVFRSANGGVNWLHMTSGIPDQAGTDLAIDPTDGDVVYAAIGYIFGSPDNGIYKTTNGGNSWTKLAGGLPTEIVGRISLAIAPSNPQRLYALYTEPSDSGGGGASALGAFRSDDAGQTWINIGNAVSQATYGWYLSVVSVQPTNPDVAIFGGYELRRTSVAGGSYSNITPPHVDLHAVAWDASGRMLIGGDGGLHRSSNLGGTYESLNTGLGIVQFYAGMSTHPTDLNRMFGGFQDNGSARRESGMNWTQVTGGDGGWTQLNQSNPVIVFTESQGTGNLYRSTNGGSSFTDAGGGLTGRNCFLPPYVIDPSNPQRVLYGTERVFRSTTGGAGGWAPISPDLTNSTTAAIRSLAIAPTNGNYVYAATNNGRVLVSTNGGTAFSLLLEDIPGWPRCTRELFVDPRNATALYLAVAAFGTDQVRRATNAGTGWTWEVLDGNLPNIPVNTVAADTRCGKPILYAGTDAGVYRSTDDGLTWSIYGAGLPKCCVVDFRLETFRDRLVIATQGRGAWSIPIFRAIDINEDGQVTVADFGAFQSTYVLGNMRADFNNDGELTVADFGAFQTAVVVGCQ